MRDIVKKKLKASTLCYVIGLLWLYKPEVLTYYHKLFSLSFIAVSLLQLGLAALLLVPKKSKVNLFDGAIIVFCLMLLATTLLHAVPYSECIKEIIRILLIWSTVKIGTSYNLHHFIKTGYQISLLFTLANSLTVLLFPQAMFKDVTGVATVFLLGGDNTSVRLYILCTMFGILYAYYQNNRFDVPWLSLLNMAFFTIARDIATGKIMVVLIFAAVIFLKMKEADWMNPLSALVANGIFFCSFVLMQSVSSIYDAVFLLLGRNSTLTQRTTLWKIALKWISKQPIQGYGYLDADTFNHMVKTFTRTGLHNTGNPHNTYLTILLAGGIPLLIVFILMLFATYQESTNAKKHIRSVLSCFLFIMMFHAQVEGKDTAFIIMVCCMITCLSRAKTQNHPLITNGGEILKHLHRKIKITFNDKRRF